MDRNDVRQILIINDFLDQMKMMQSLGPLEGCWALAPRRTAKIKKQLSGRRPWTQAG